MVRQRIKVISIFPGMFSSFLETSLIEKAQKRGLVSISTSGLRDFADPPHYHVDDTPYGGGAGMVLKPEPLLKAIEAAKEELPKGRVILLSANGHRLTQKKAAELALLPEIIYVCGRYEGVDQRAIDTGIDEEISIGDYVLMGGEVAAMVVMEASIRLIDQVLGNPDSICSESFIATENGTLLEGPQYTRPAEFRGQSVPMELISGDHARIAEWRKTKSLERTKKNRPDLLTSSDSTNEKKNYE